MTKTKDKMKETFEKWIEWKFYKILYIGVLVPLLIEEARRWILQDFAIALIFFITAIILVVPAIFKVGEWLELVVDYFDF